MVKMIKTVFIDDLGKKLSPTDIEKELSYVGRHLTIINLDNNREPTEFDVFRPLAEIMQWKSYAEYLSTGSEFEEYICVVLNSSIFTSSLGAKGRDRITGVNFVSKFCSSFKINAPHVLVTHGSKEKEGCITESKFIDSLAGMKIYTEFDSLKGYAETIKPNIPEDSNYPKKVKYIQLNSRNITKINY